MKLAEGPGTQQVCILVVLLSLFYSHSETRTTLPPKLIYVIFWFTFNLSLSECFLAFTFLNFLFKRKKRITEKWYFRFIKSRLLENQNLGFLENDAQIDWHKPRDRWNENWYTESGYKERERVTDRQTDRQTEKDGEEQQKWYVIKGKENNREGQSLKKKKTFIY